MPTVDQYIIQRSPTGVSDWVNVGTVSGATTTFTDTGLTADTTYYYRVFAQNDEGTSAASNVANATTGGAPDPDFNDVTLLLAMGGADGSTTFIDSSNSARTITAFADAQIDTALAPFGSVGSGLFDGLGDYISAVYVKADMDWWTEDYTVEAWIYPNTLTNWSAPNGAFQMPVLIGNQTATSTTNFWSFGPHADGSISLYYFRGSQAQIKSSSGLITTGSWQHVAMVQSGGTVSLYVDGVLAVSAAYTGTPQSNIGTDLVMGASNNRYMDGNVYGFRITKGVARYTGAFTPPNEPFPTS